MNGASRIPCRISAGWRTGRTARAPSAAAAAPARAALPLPGSAARRLRDGGRAGGPSLAGGHNARPTGGFSRLQMSIRQGRRCSAATAYLRPALRQPNLRVETGAHVLGLDFDGDRATGLRYLRGGRQRGAGAARGHLAAGAINTPAILMHSGIGPARVLEQAGLSVRLDRPGVGANLQDHISVIVTARRRAPVPSCASCGWTASAARWCAPTWAAKVSPATCRAGGGLRAARGHGHARPAIPADGGAVHGPALAQALAPAVPGRLRRAHRPAASAQPGPHHGGGRGSAGRAAHRPELPGLPGRPGAGARFGAHRARPDASAGAG